MNGWRWAIWRHPVRPLGCGRIKPMLLAGIGHCLPIRNANALFSTNIHWQIIKSFANAKHDVIWKERILPVSIRAQLPAHSVYVYGWQRDVYSADCSAIHAVFLIKPCHMEEKVWGVLEWEDQRRPPRHNSVDFEFANGQIHRLKVECHRQISWGEIGLRDDMEMCLQASETARSWAEWTMHIWWGRKGISQSHDMNSFYLSSNTWYNEINFIYSFFNRY